MWRERTANHNVPWDKLKLWRDGSSLDYIVLLLMRVRVLNFAIFTHFLTAIYTGRWSTSRCPRVLRIMPAIL